MAASPSVSEAFEAAYQEMLGDDGTPEDGTGGQPDIDGGGVAEEAPASDEELVGEPEVAGEEPGEAGDEPEPAADEGAEGADGDEPVVELAAGQTIRLPDGTEVPVDKAVLFQADYTRKTQELAEQRREFQAEREQVEQLQQQVDETFGLMKEWYEPRAANPTMWAQEILSETPDPTRALVKVMYDLAQMRAPDGRTLLDPKFVQMFGLDEGDLADTAQAVQRDDELEQLRAKVEQQEQAQQEQARIRAQAAEYQREWDDIKLTNGLEFSTPAEEREAKQELLQFIRQTGIDRSLIDAYDLMQARKARTAPPEPAPATPRPAPKKARGSQAVTPRSAAGGAGARPQAATPPTTREALKETLAEMAGAQ